MRRARKLAKPWYMRNVEIGPSMTLPVSPVTVGVLFLSIFYLMYFWSGKPVYVVASHILLDKDPEAEEKLEEWKAKIGKDASSFAKFARAHSSCPSKQNGGMLGKFKKQDMTPKFDKLCFDPAVSPAQLAAAMMFGKNMFMVLSNLLLFLSGRKRLLFKQQLVRSILSLAGI